MGWIVGRFFEHAGSPPPSEDRDLERIVTRPYLRLRTQVREREHGAGAMRWSSIPTNWRCSANGRS